MSQQIAKRVNRTLTAGPQRALLCPTEPLHHKQPAAPLHAFESERLALLERDAGTRVIALDLSGPMALPYPATTPNMLARYLVVGRNEKLPLLWNAVVAIYYVMEGSGHSDCNGTRIAWQAGDVFLLPGGVDAVHVARREGRALYLATDEPMLSFAGTTVDRGGAPRVVPTLFSARQTDHRLSRTYSGLHYYSRTTRFRFDP